jgi:hypothetical protein
MSYQLPRIICASVFAVVLFSCSKGKGSSDGPPAQFQPITFKFGPDSTAVTIDNAVQTLKNMTRGADAKQLAASASVPAGYNISPNPNSAQDYTKGVTYTIANSSGKTYTIQITIPAYDAVSNPYGIYTPKQLSDIRKGLTDSYVLMNDIQLPDLTAPNAASITGISDYKDYGWYSIGATYVNGGHVIFRGSLDGQNHVIKNLTSIYRPNSAPLPAGIDAGRNGKSTDGIFGNAIGATFKNIGIQLSSTGLRDIDVNNEAYGYVASLVGLADTSTITNCYVIGTTNIAGGQYTAGLIAGARNSTITKCYANLTPAVGSYAIASSDGGGLIATSYNSTITDCYASASIISSVSVGGLIGAVNTCTVKTCYATGNVTETPMNSSQSLIASNNLGGLIGTLSSAPPATSTVQNCYALGAVTGANGTNTDFHKSTRIGGLIGSLANTSGPVSVSNCYAAGAVSRVWTNATAPFLIGALVGNTPNGVFITSGTCTNYWDKTTTGQTNLGGGNATFAQDNGFTANGKTTAEMKTSGTYANWDFSSIWNVSSGTSNGYPSLRTVIK